MDPNENIENVENNASQSANDQQNAVNGQQSQQQDSSNNAGNDKPERTFTQDDVSRMMTREKKQGRNSAYNELGIDPSDKKTVAMIKAFIASQNAGEDVEVTTEADQALADAEHRANVAEAKVKAMEAGCKAQYVDDLIVLVTNKFEDDENAEFETLLGEMKKKYPSWFASSSDSDESSIGKRGTGASIKQTSVANNSNDSKNQSLGHRLAANRLRSQKKKSSYFNN